MLKNQSPVSFIQPPSVPIIIISSVFLFVGLLLTVALFSYNVADPAWRHNGDTPISNSLGFLGAWYSDLSFSLIGKLSYLLPLALFAFFIHAWREKSIDKELFSWRLFMLLTAILSGCVLWTKHDAHILNSVAQTGGGAVGAWLVIGLEKSIQSVPVIMAFSALIFGISVSLLFNIPWGRIAEGIGASLATLFSNLLFFRTKPAKSGQETVADAFIADTDTAPYTQTTLNEQQAQPSTQTPIEQTQIQQAQSEQSSVAEASSAPSKSQLRTSVTALTGLLRGKAQALGGKVQALKQSIQHKSRPATGQVSQEQAQQPQQRAPMFTIDPGEANTPAYTTPASGQSETRPTAQDNTQTAQAPVPETPVQLGNLGAENRHSAPTDITEPALSQTAEAYDLGLGGQSTRSEVNTAEPRFFDFSPEPSTTPTASLDEQASSQHSPVTQQAQLAANRVQQPSQPAAQSEPVDNMDNFISTLTRGKQNDNIANQADIITLENSDEGHFEDDAEDSFEDSAIFDIAMYQQEPESIIELLSHDIPEAKPQRPKADSLAADVPVNSPSPLAQDSQHPQATPLAATQSTSTAQVVPESNTTLDTAVEPQAESLIQSQAAPLQSMMADAIVETPSVSQDAAETAPRPAVAPAPSPQPVQQPVAEDAASPIGNSNVENGDDDLIAQTVIPPLGVAEVNERVDTTPAAETKTTATIGKAYDNSEAQVSIKKIEAERAYALPSVQLLDTPPQQQNAYTEDVLAEMAGVLESTLQQFNIRATVMYVSPGPVITRFELDLAPGIQAKKITNLSVDLARALAVSRVRVEEVIPGSSYVGLEVPNKQRQIVYFKDLVCSQAFRDSQSPLTISLGSDTSGRPQVVDLMKMPHALVAGTTGSGKSVCINVMLLSMLYKASPKDLRLILVDPKMLEMSMYEDIPHLLTPVITDMNEAENALTWAVGEMERRYQLMAALKVRKIDAFNAAVEAAIAKGEPLKDPLWEPDEQVGYTHHPTLERLPFIVIVIDELADMMMVVGKQVEQLIARLTQKARAAGIHVVLATQRPSTDVLTGLIKANVPTRLAFQVSSGTDSRVIIDSVGAEKLLGHGDMLYVPPGASHPQRLHGAFVGDAETDRVTDYLRSTGEPDYITGITQKQDPETLGAFGAAEAADSKVELDPLYNDAVAVVLETGKASISSVQRHLRIGYNRAARMIEDMQTQGIVSEPVNGVRKVLGKK